MVQQEEMVRSSFRVSPAVSYSQVLEEHPYFFHPVKNLHGPSLW